MSKKQELDQYYTSPAVAEMCVSEFQRFTRAKDRHLVIEPSAGDGSFLNHIRANFRDFRACDLEPKSDYIIKGDWLKASRESLNITTAPANTAVLGNPPFGWACSLAVKFFNHAATMADTIAFIIPRTFRKSSLQAKLNPAFHLVFDMELPKNSFVLHGKPYDVPCVFQVWQRRDTAREVNVRTTSKQIKFVNKSLAYAMKAAGKEVLAIRRVGGRSGRVLDGLDYSASTTYFIAPADKQAAKRLYKLDLTVVDDTAGVRSISKAEIIRQIESM